MTPGTKVGHYEIREPLGKGGMGEVYCAFDPKLGREVAIKILPEAFAEDAERLARFEREAKVLAALNHPNIAAIYGVEDRALVMELVEGEMLHGPMPVDRALPIIQQLIDALEYAHEKGIVHRDFKPANIKITPEGRVKVLDFGLAKALANEAPTGDSADSPTITMRATQAGVIMGTAAYMAPEQARGHNVDRRADIWAFSVVVYEMLTGKRLFRGETVSDTLAAVLRQDPDFSPIPPRFRKLLQLCLTRDPKQRLRDIGDARFLMSEVDSGPQVGRSAPLLPWIIAAALAVALAIAGELLYRATRPAPLRPLVRLNVELGPDTPLARGRSGGMLALSPDGTRLAVTFRGSDGKVRLGTRALDQNQITALAGTEDADSPFFSPDGQWIGFSADGKLKKISINGGAAVALCDAYGSGSWGDDGNIVFAPSASGGLFRVSAAGGTPVPVTKINRGETRHSRPQVLPGNQAVLFTAPTGSFDDANIDVVFLKTGQRKTIQRGGFSARYLTMSTGAGYLIYLHQSTLFAVPFDLRRLALAGAPVPILEDVGSYFGGGDFAFAATGTFVYITGLAAGWPILWLDSSGKTQRLQVQLGHNAMPRFSPDGKRLAFLSINGADGDIWVEDLERGTASRLTFLSGLNDWPVWTPDGKNIVFRSLNQNSPGLYWIRSDGSGEAQRLTDSKLRALPHSFSPDGKRLAFSVPNSSGNQDIFTAAIEGDPDHPRLGKPELFLGTPFNEVRPAFSADWKWLAYGSNESGTFEVYVRPFPGPVGRWQISTGGGTNPVWSRHGRELFFLNPDGRIMVVSYTAGGGSFNAGRPRVWSQTRVRLSIPSSYDLAPDGKRFAIVPPEGSGGDKPVTQVTFLLNFFDELQRRVPAGGK